MLIIPRYGDISQQGKSLAANIRLELAHEAVQAATSMNTVVSFKTPNGEEMIILSRHDYDLLLEKAVLAEDVATVAEYRKKLVKGEEEAVPEAFANRLVDGENPIRVYRQLRGLTAQDLAERTGISAAFLSEIETGKKDGGIATLKRIAQELRVALDDLVNRMG